MPLAINASLFRALTLILPAFLLSKGIWGLFSPVVYGVLTTNRTHAIVHILLGVAGLIARWKGAIKGYFGFLGSLLIVVAFLWLLPATRDVLSDLLNMNSAVAILNFVLGVVALAIAITANPRRRFGSPTGRTNPPMKIAGKSGTTRPGF